MPDTNRLGRFIRECRTGLGYTSRKVEEITRSRPELATISHSNLLAIEKGSHVPTFDKVLTLALVFNVPTGQFETRLKHDMLGEPRPSPGVSYEQHMLLAQTALAEGHHQGALENFMRGHALALTEPVSGERAMRLAEAQLQAANCRKRLGLLRVAKDDLEDLLGAEETPTSVAVRSSFLLAEVYRDLNNHRLALLHARAALEMAPEGTDSVLHARILTTVANIFSDRNDIQSAIEYYRRALDVFVSLGDTRAAGLVSRNLGVAYLRNQELDQALAMLTHGIEVARANADRRGLAYGLVNVARVHYIKGSHEPARESAREAKQIAQSENYPDVLFASLFYLWNVAVKRRESSLARVYADRLGTLHRKLETRCVESDEWSSHIEASRRVRA